MDEWTLEDFGFNVRKKNEEDEWSLEDFGFNLQKNKADKKRKMTVQRVDETSSTVQRDPNKPLAPSLAESDFVIKQPPPRVVAPTPESIKERLSKSQQAATQDFHFKEEEDDFSRLFKKYGLDDTAVDRREFLDRAILQDENPTKIKKKYAETYGEDLKFDDWKEARRVNEIARKAARDPRPGAIAAWNQEAFGRGEHALQVSPELRELYLRAYEDELKKKGPERGADVAQFIGRGPMRTVLDTGFIVDNMMAAFAGDDSVSEEFKKNVDFLEQIRSIQTGQYAEQGVDIGDSTLANYAEKAIATSEEAAAQVTQMLGGAGLGKVLGGMGGAAAGIRGAKVGGFLGTGAINAGMTFPSSLKYAEEELGLEGGEAKAFALVSTGIQMAIENAQVKGIMPKGSAALSPPSIMKRVGSALWGAAKTTGLETLEEGAQAAVDRVMGQTVKSLKGEGFDITDPVNEAVREMKGVVGSMAMIALPELLGKTAGARSSQRTYERVQRLIGSDTKFYQEAQAVSEMEPSRGTFNRMSPELREALGIGDRSSERERADAIERLKEGLQTVKAPPPSPPEVAEHAGAHKAVDIHGTEVEVTPEGPQPAQPILPEMPAQPKQYAEGKEYGRQLEQDEERVYQHLRKFATKDESDEDVRAAAKLFAAQLTTEDIDTLTSVRGGTPGKGALHQVREAVDEVLQITGGKTQTNEKKMFGPGGILARGFQAAKKKLGLSSPKTLTPEGRSLMAGEGDTKQFEKDAGAAFEKYVNKAGARKIVDRAVDEVRKFMEQPGNERFAQYYETQAQEELEVLRQRFPDLEQDPKKFQFYRMLNAIASAQTELGKNTEETMQAYGGILATGRIPVKFDEDGKPVYALSKPLSSKGEGPTPMESSTISKNSKMVADRISSEVPDLWNHLLNGTWPEGLITVGDSKQRGKPVDSFKRFLYDYMAPKYIKGSDHAGSFTTSDALILRLAIERAKSSHKEFRNRVRSAMQIGGGSSMENKAYNYQSLNMLLDRTEFQVQTDQGSTIDQGKVVDWLNERVTWKELQAEREKLGYGKFPADVKREIQDTVWTAEGQEELFPRTFIFGPKVGAYMLNRMSDADPRNADYNTMDVWESRFWRYMADDVKDDEAGIAAGVPRRVYMRLAREFPKAWKKATGTDMSVSGGQAARWYLMKEAAAKAGYAKAGAVETIPYHTMKALDKYLDMQLAVGREGDMTQELAAAFPETAEQEIAAQEAPAEAVSTEVAAGVAKKAGRPVAEKEVSIKPAEAEGIAESTNKVIVSLFQKRDGRIVGSMEEIKKDGRVKILLRALKGSNLETGMHEMAHAIRRLVLNREVPASVRGISDKSLDAIENYYGVKDGQWTREQEERFAEDLLKRMQRPPRTAPKTKLAKAMTRVMNYLTNFYKQVKSGALGDVPMDPVWEDLFDALVSRRERLTMKKANAGIQMVRNNSTDANLKEILDKAKVDKGGTVDMKDLSRPKTGFGVAPDKATETVLDDATPENVREFVSKYEDRLGENKNHLGLWVNDKGQMVLDVSRVEPDLDTAMNIARDAKQDGVWDFANNKFIDTKEYFEQKGKLDEGGKKKDVRAKAPKKIARVRKKKAEEVSGRGPGPAEEVRDEGVSAREPAAPRARAERAAEPAKPVRAKEEVAEYHPDRAEEIAESLSQGRIDWSPYGQNGQRTGKAKPAREVVRDILASVGINIDTFTEYTGSPGTLGFYRWVLTKAKLVDRVGRELWLKTSELASIHTATHEVAHFLDQKFNISGKVHQLSSVPGLVQPQQADRGFLSRVPGPVQMAFRMLDYYPAQHNGTLRPDPISGMAEGWAEACRLYVTAPDPAAVLSPDVKSTMDAIILQNPEIAELLNNARVNAQAYLNATDAEKVQMMLHDPRTNLAVPSESYFARSDRQARWRRYMRYAVRVIQNRIRDLEEYERVLFNTFKEHWTQAGTGQTLADAKKAWNEILEETGGLASRMLLNVQNAVSRSLDRAINEGIYDPVTDRRIGGSASDIFTNFTNQGQIDDFGRYMYAKVALYRHAKALAEGKQYVTGEAELSVLQRLVAATEAGPDGQLHIKAAADVTEYFNNLLEIEVNAGLLTKGAAQAMKDQQLIYMPFFRRLDDDAPYGTGGKVLGVKAVNRRLKGGSVMPVLDVYDAIIDRTSEVMSVALRKEAEKAFIRQAELSGVAGNFVRKITAEEAEKTEDVVKITTDGTTFYYKVDPDLRRALSLTNPSMAPAVAKILDFANDWVTGIARKWMVTFNLPYFVAKNFVVDLKTNALRGLRATDTETGGARIVYDSALRGLTDAGRAIYGVGPADTDVERLFKNQGLAKMTRIKTSKAKKLNKAQKRRLFLKDRGRTTTQAVMDWMENAKERMESINDAIELAPRRQAFLQTLELLSKSQNAGFTVNKDGSITGTVPRWALTQATYNSMEVTTNFNRRGEWAPFFEPLFLFFNASVQGTATMVDTGRGAIESPAHRKRLAVAVAIAAAAKIAMLAAMAADEDEEGVSSLEKWAELAHYLHEANDIFVWKGHVITIPREREWGFFGKLVDSFIQQKMLGGEGRKMERAIEVMRGEAAAKLPLTGGAASVILQLFFGYDVFQDEPIESEWDKKKRVKNRFDDRTLSNRIPLLPEIGEWVSLSPKEMDFVFRNAAGSMIPKLMDWAGGGGKMSSTPFIGPYMHDLIPRQSYTDYHVFKERAGQLYDDWAKHGGEYTDSDLEWVVDTMSTVGMADTIFKVIRDSDLPNEEKQRWTTGLARWALDRDPLPEYPNPLKDFTRLPPKISQAVLKELKEVQAAKVVPTKAEPKGSEGFKQKQLGAFRLRKKVAEARQ